MKRFRIAVVSLLLIAALLSAFQASGSDRQVPAGASFIEGMGSVLFAAAWPTASFERMKIGTIAPRPDGAWEVSLELHGKSAWTGDPLWTQLVVTLQSGKIERMRWGRHNGFFRPGFAWETAEELLHEVNKQTTENPSHLDGSDLLTQAWTVVDQCNDDAGLRIRFFERAKPDRPWSWPGGEDFYEVPRGGTRTFHLRVRPNVRVCFGAVSTRPGDSGYWGLGIEGKQGCKACCFAASVSAIKRRLTCEVRTPST